MTAVAAPPRERPILFSGEMVRAILDGRKTQTRRVVTTTPQIQRRGLGRKPIPSSGALEYRDGAAWDAGKNRAEPIARCPFGERGDRLWVREAFSYSRNDEWHRSDFWYWADGNPSDGDWEKPKPSIHMPRWASRLTLEVTGIRVERLQDITNADATAEGIEVTSAAAFACGLGFPSPMLAYRQLWDSLNAKRGYGWDVNPWVWVIEFRKIDQ